MVIEEKTTGEQENTTAETVNEPPLRKKRSREDNEDNLYKSALKSLQKEPDDFDKFGQYVALELKSFKSDFNKGKLKSKIRKIIVRIADEDLYFGPSTSSTSVPSTSSTPVPSTSSTPVPSTSTTPMPSPAFQLTPEYQSCRDYDNTFTYTDI